MSFLTHHSRHSWPPFMHFTTPPAAHPTVTISPSIDENPFSFFVSPAPSDDDDFAEDWTAGIASSISGHEVMPSIPTAITLSPLSRIGLHRNAHTTSSSITEAAKTPSAVLRRWAAYVEKHQPQLLFRHQKRSNSRTSSPASSPASSPRLSQAVLRGREKDEYAARARGRRSSRSRSSRPHSWREPSVDLYTVPEEKESGEEIDRDNTCPSKASRPMEQRARL